MKCFFCKNNASVNRYDTVLCRKCNYSFDCIEKSFANIFEKVVYLNGKSFDKSDNFIVFDYKYIYKDKYISLYVYNNKAKNLRYSIDEVKNIGAYDYNNETIHIYFTPKKSLSYDLLPRKPTTLVVG